MVRHSLLVRTIARVAVFWQRNRSNIMKWLARISITALIIAMFISFEYVSFAIGFIGASRSNTTISMGYIIVGHIITYSTIPLAYIGASSNSRVKRYIDTFLNARTRRCRVNIKDAILQDKLRTK